MNALCNFMSSRSLKPNSREKLRMHVASIIHVKNNMNAHVKLYFIKKFGPELMRNLTTYVAWSSIHDSCQTIWMHIYVALCCREVWTKIHEYTVQQVLFMKCHIHYLHDQQDKFFWKIHIVLYRKNFHNSKVL